MNIPAAYEHLITVIEHLCGGRDKFAHTYAGMAIWIGAAFFLPKPLGSRWPLLTVLAIELANECMDRLAHGSWMWSDTLGDIAATMFWPMMLTLAFRHTRLRPRG